MPVRCAAIRDDGEVLQGNLLSLQQLQKSDSSRRFTALFRNESRKLTD
jgi:hypothetical protein